MKMVIQLHQHRKKRIEAQKEQKDSKTLLNLVNNSSSKPKPTTTTGQEILDQLPDDSIVYAKTGGLPQLIFWEITGELDVEIVQRKEELRKALVARGNAGSEAQQLYGLLNGAVVNTSDAATQSLIDLGAVEDCHVGKVSMADPIVKQAVLLLREEKFEVNDE